MKNDRFKFRAWNKKTKAMVDLYKLTPLALSHTLSQDGIFIPFGMDKFILMQSTGLKDSEDKLIYEGDIFNFKGHTHPECLSEPRVYKAREHFDNPVVSWNDDLACFELVSEHTFQLDECLEKPFKVIGNIYENPELLKENTLNG